MKVWRFYKKPESKDTANQSYDLYALTNNKEYAKYFLNTRDMNKFFVRCTKEDRETYVKIANDNRDCVLDEFELVTRNVNVNGIINHTRLLMCITFYEYQCINGDEFQCEITGYREWWDGVPNYKNYKKKIKNALRVLEYVSNYKFYAMPFDTSGLEEQDDDYSAPNIWIDELGAFISTFKSTLKV